MSTLNQFTGMSDRTLRIRMMSLRREWRAIRSSDGHGGSPGEGTLEMIDDLEAEMKRRTAAKRKSVL